MYIIDRIKTYIELMTAAREMVIVARRIDVDGPLADMFKEAVNNLEKRYLKASEVTND